MSEQPARVKRGTFPQLIDLRDLAFERLMSVMRDWHPEDIEHFAADVSDADDEFTERGGTIGVVCCDDRAPRTLRTRVVGDGAEPGEDDESRIRALAECKETLERLDPVELAEFVGAMRAGTDGRAKADELFATARGRINAEPVLNATLPTIEQPGPADDGKARHVGPAVEPAPDRLRFITTGQEDNIGSHAARIREYREIIGPTLADAEAVRVGVIIDEGGGGYTIIHDHVLLGPHGQAVEHVAAALDRLVADLTAVSLPDLKSTEPAAKSGDLSRAGKLRDLVAVLDGLDGKTFTEIDQRIRELLAQRDCWGDDPEPTPELAVVAEPATAAAGADAGEEV